MPTEQRAAMVSNLGLRVAPFVEEMKAHEKERTVVTPGENSFVTGSSMINPLAVP